MVADREMYKEAIEGLIARISNFKPADMDAAADFLSMVTPRYTYISMCIYIYEYMCVCIYANMYEHVYR